MTATLRRVDGVYQLVIPDEVAAAAGLGDGNELTLTPSAGRFTAERTGRRYSLAELLAQVRPEQLHGETDWGPPVGKERFWE